MSRKPISAAEKARKQRAKTDLRLIRDFRPPEGVPLNFEVASLGMRFAAQLIDILLTVLFTGSIIFLLAIMDVSWTALTDQDRGVAGLLAIMRSTRLEDAVDAGRFVVAPAQNVTSQESGA